MQHHTEDFSLTSDIHFINELRISEQAEPKSTTPQKTTLA